MAGYISAGMATALGQGMTPQRYHQQMAANRYAPAANTGARAQWANQQLMDQMAARANPSAATWRPAYLDTPMPTYPSQSFGGSSRGGGVGGMYMPSANAYNPTMFYGPGAYMPAHQAQFQQQMQNAMLHIAGGSPFQETMGQPALVAAAQQRALRTPQGRLAAGLPLYGSRGGGGSSGGGSLADSYQAALDRANQANEARFRDALQGSQALHERAMGYLDGAGAQEAADIRQAFDAQQAASQQNLIGRGLGNSTILETMKMGNQRERADALGRLNERLRNQYLNTDIDTTRGTLGLLERKTDQAPDINQMIALAQLQGQAGGGGGYLPQAYQVSMAPAASIGYAPVYGYVGGAGRDAGMAQAATSMGMTPQQVRANLVNQNRYGGLSGAEWAEMLRKRQGNAGRLI